MADVSEDDEMKLISVIAKETGVNRHTIKKWAEKGLLDPVEFKATSRYVAWYTTVAAVRAVQANPPKMGRPPKRT